MRPRSAVLTDQELEIMKVVWEHQSPTVRDVYEALLKRRKIAYTTVMTMMNILVEKKYLKKRSGERAYTYQPTQPKQQVIKAMVSDFLGRVFDGSAQPLLVHLVDDRRLTEKDLEELQRMIEEER